MTEQLMNALQATPLVIKNNGGDYIPIGEQEKMLDAIFDGWETVEFKFNAIQVEGRLLISAQIYLRVWSDSFSTGRVGAISFWVTGAETGIDADYAGIAKSYALNNACKSLGKVFGRELNDRVEYSQFTTEKNTHAAPTEISTDHFKNKIKL